MVAKIAVLAPVKVAFALMMVSFVAGCDMSSMDSTDASAAAATASGATASPTATPATTTSPTATNSVGSAEVSWQPPQQNNDGSALTDLAGYRIYYGNTADNLSRVVNIATVGVSLYVIDNLTAGTWFFAVRAYNASGIESDLSNLASKTIG